MISQWPFSEMDTLEHIIELLKDRADVDVINQVTYKNHQFPLYCITLGSNEPDVPVLAFFGGVHGLEKIGSEVIFAYLHTIIELLQWDSEFVARLKHSRLVFFPMVNPVGIYLGTRCNANGVDLMRNSPIRGSGKRNFCSGHRLTRHLPWYQGDPEAMEIEAKALCDVVRNKVLNASRSICIDVHSGFGIHDRLWFPYAYSKSPFPNSAEVYAWKALFDKTYPNHFYRIEPMSREYLIDGDLWDYLYLEFLQHNQDKRLFLPFTLELGSWLWLRKNPKHLFKRHGFFHPLVPHRKQRILRRHLTLFDFLFRSLLNPDSWLNLENQVKQDYLKAALKLWYAS